MMEIKKSNSDDNNGILQILNEAKGDSLSEKEKAKYGFIQGSIDVETIKKSQSDLGVFVAKIDGDIVGVAIASRIGVVTKGPATKLYTTVLKNISTIKKNELFLYGPVTIKKEYRGKGITTLLLKKICSEFEKEFKLGAAFVEQTNEKSLQIHRHYPMNESGTFIFKDKNYSIFTFKPKNIILFYTHN